MVTTAASSIRDGKYGKDRYVIIDQTTMAMLVAYTRYMTRDAFLFDLSGKQIWRMVRQVRGNVRSRRPF